MTSDQQTPEPPRPEPPRRPERPRAAEPSRHASSRLSNWMAPLFALFAMVLGLGALFILPLGFMGIAFILGSFLFAGMLAFHYLVWGRWIDRVLKDEEQRDTPDSPNDRTR